MRRRVVPAWARKRRKIQGSVETNPTDRNYGNPEELSATDRRLWDRVYSEAFEIYGDKTYAEGCAWRAVRYRQGHEMADAGLVTGRLPNPGDTIILGKLIEFVWMDKNNQGELTPYRLIFKPGMEPALLWSRKHMMLCAFKDVEIPEFREPLQKNQRHLEVEYKRWSQRKPRGAAYVQVPAETIRPVGPADTVVYRSSKWTDVPDDPPGAQEYIHQFGERVVFGASTGFSVMVWRGGNLDVLPAGIVN